MICQIGPDLKTNYIQLILEMQKAQNSLAWRLLFVPLQAWIRLKLLLAEKVVPACALGSVL